MREKASSIDDIIAVSPFANPNCSVKSPIYIKASLNSATNTNSSVLENKIVKWGECSCQRKIGDNIDYIASVVTVPKMLNVTCVTYVTYKRLGVWSHVAHMTHVT